MIGTIRFTKIMKKMMLLILIKLTEQASCLSHLLFCLIIVQMYMHISQNTVFHPEQLEQM